MKRLWLICALGLVLSGQGCRQFGPQPSTDPQKVGKGLSLSPQSFSQDDMTQFFDLALRSGNIITWGGDASELTNENAGYHVVMSQARVQGYIPVSIFGIRHIVNASMEERNAFYKHLETFAKENQPAYIGIGNEINFVLQDHSDHLPPWADMFREARQHILTVSPNTKVFPVFQYESMKGLRGGLFGGTNNDAQNQWYMLRAFDSADLIGFTTYPGMIYQTPEDIPLDYYDAISAHTNKPIAITETGWFRKSSVPGWESSMQEQAGFIKRWFALMNPLHPVFVTWSFLFDPKAQPPFDTMGLIPHGTTSSVAWKAWQAAHLDK